MGFADAAEVVTYIGGIFEAAFQDDELSPKLRDTGVVLKFDLSDPETALVVDMANGVVQEGEGNLTIGATMTMAADVANAYWQGKENLPLAMAKGKIKVSGEIATLLRVAPLSQRLFPTYIERLRRDGRDDLLVD
jgi:putative sterol carrier protein